MVINQLPGTRAALQDPPAWHVGPTARPDRNAANVGCSEGQVIVLAREQSAANRTSGSRRLGPQPNCERCLGNCPQEAPCHEGTIACLGQSLSPTLTAVASVSAGAANLHSLR